MANGKPKKWSTEVDKAKPQITNVSDNVGLYGEVDEFAPSFVTPKLPGVLGTNQTSGVLDSTGQNWFDKLKSGLGKILAQGAENVGKGEVYTAQGQSDLGKLIGPPIVDFLSPKMPADPYWNPITKTRGISPYYEGDISGIQDSTWSDAQKMAMAVKNAMSQNKGDIKPSDYYWGDQSGVQGGLGTDLMTDAQKKAVSGDPYYGIENGTLDYSKIGPGGIEDKKVSGPASALTTGESGKPEAIAALTATTPPEGLQNESGGVQWADAFKALQAQYADPKATQIDLPVVYNADGSLADFYIDQKTRTQVPDGKGGTTTTTTTRRVLDPRYEALQDYAINAQKQKNWQADQKQQMDIQQLGIFPQLLEMLTTPGVADILGLMGGAGVDPLFQPMFGQGFGLPSTVQDTFLPAEQGGDIDMLSTLPASAQPAMQQRQHLPTESYIQRLGPDALEGLKGLMGFMGQTPYDLQRMVGSVTPQFSGIFPGGGVTGQPTGVR